MTERKYAKELTRDYLEYLGITHVTEDGLHIYKGEKELNQAETKNGYLNVLLYDPAVRQAVPMEERNNSTGNMSIGVHRVVYAWYNRIQPPGMVIDHIDCNKKNNHLSNLQCLTPAENLEKERGLSTRQLKCHLKKPRSFYEESVAYYTAEYERAKEAHDEVLTHRMRSNLSNARARLRYWDAHQAEREALYNALDDMATRREYRHRRAAQLRQFREELKILHDRYTEAQKTYGPDHEITRAAKAKWKKGITISSEWIANHPAVSIKEA